MSVKPWGNRNEASKAQSERMERLHQAMEPFKISIAGYKKLRSILPAHLPIRIGKTLKGCAVSISTLTDERPAVIESLITKMQNASKPAKARAKGLVKKRRTTTIKPAKKIVRASDQSTKKFADSMTLDEINRLAPYSLKQLNNGDWAIKLGAIQYMRFDGIVWARYYCETLNSGYRDMLRDLKESKAK